MKLTTDWISSKSVARLFSAFESRGHQILFVGGCVRNALLGVPVSDLDISTSALPEQTIAIAKSEQLKFIPTGLEHGTITVVIDEHSFEITSFRKDVETHGRRAVVAFSDDIVDDALRRDFTMNALYADRFGTVIDPLRGIDDLQDRKIRFIANADDRIKEDYLRILRYFRFHAWYGNQDDGMDADAMSAIAANVEGLSLISKERIGSEMRKILAAPDPVRTVAAMENSGVLGQILSGASARALGPLTVLEQSLSAAIDWQRRSLALGGANLVGQLRLSKVEAQRIKRYLQAMNLAASTRENAYRYGRETALDVAMISAASLAAPLPNDLQEQIDQGVAARFPITASDLPKTFKGKAIGDRLKALEARWIASGFELTKQDLLG